MQRYAHSDHRKYFEKNPAIVLFHDVEKPPSISRLSSPRRTGRTYASGYAMVAEAGAETTLELIFIGC
jgi:hypothetical protein